MYKNLIQSYINNISKNDISKFVETKEINATNKDIDTMYKYITNYKNDLLNNPNKYIEMIKNDVSFNCYKEILKYYEKYKKSI